MTLKRKPWFFLVYALPGLHLVACLTIAAARIDSGWEQLIKIDFPFSLALVVLTWRSDQPLLWFGILGTAWWYFLSRIVYRLLAAGRGFSR
jgi:hypothetical protein